MEIGIGRRQNADVHLDGVGGAERRELLLLDDAQQLDLGFGPEGADLIEENGAAVGHLEIPLLGLNGAGEGASHMPEEGRFQQVRRQRSAVHGDEHLVGARRIGMDGFGDEFLAGAGLAGDEDGGAAGSHLGHQVEHADHALALADDVGETVALLEGALEVGVLVFEPPPDDHAVDLDEELLVIPGLGEIVVGAELEGVDRGLDRAVGGDHENGGFAVVLADLVEHVHAGAVGHHEVEQDEVVAADLHFLEPFGGVLGLIDGIAFRGEEDFQAFADIGLVVDYQHLALESGSRELGSSHVKQHSPASSPSRARRGEARGGRKRRRPAG